MIIALIAGNMCSAALVLNALLLSGLPTWLEIVLTVIDVACSFTACVVWEKTKDKMKALVKYVEGETDRVKMFAEYVKNARDKDEG